VASAFYGNLRPTRLTIGILFENMPNEQQDYLAEVLAGAVAAAQENDVNLLGFAGGHLYHTFYNEFDTQRNILYELVGPENVHGLIILGTIGTYAPLHKTIPFYYRYAPLPTIKVGQPLEDIPTVVADEEAGVYAAMVHLIRDHHYRRIALIDYPENYPYLRPRHNAYQKALTDYGIPLDPRLIVPGDWTVRSGREAIPILLDERRVSFDALVASNDNMALGAMEVLQARGIHVPYDVAIVGFDDAQMSRLVMPSLTTVRQPMFELGKRALQALLAAINGDTLPPQIVLPTELLIRQSCGCQDPPVARTMACASVPIVSPQADGDVNAHREPIIAELAQIIGPTAETQSQATQLFDAAMADLQAQPAGTFLPTLDKILRRSVERGDDITRWQDVISRLRVRLQPHLGDPLLICRAEDLWHQARVFIGETTRKQPAQRQLRIDQQNILIRMFGQALVTTFDMDTLLHIVADQMVQLNIPGCYIALYENPQPYTYPQPAPEWAQLVLAYRENALRGVIAPDKPEAGAWRFRTPQLLPSGLLPSDRRYTLIVEPLYFQNHQIGLALLEMGPREGAVYEVVREQISSALESVLLFQEQKRAEAALSKAYMEVEEQVRQRTLELEQEIGERKQAESMQQMLIAELEAKNAELERFAYTVSHDLKSPLITIGGFVGFLEKDVLTGDLERMHADLAHIHDAVAKMERLLSELLELSRIGQRRPAPVAVPFAEIAGEAVTLVQGRIAACNAQVDIAPDLPIVYGDRARLVEVIQNLVDNACKFMGEQPQPRVEIGARQEQGEVVFFVRDNGVGVEPRYQDRIFELFEKLDPQSEGAGVGLALVKRIVEMHGGKIWVESAGSGQGCTFCFTLAKPTSA